VGTALDGVLEYLEDPTPGITAMAAVAREVSMPLATNMCVVGFEDIPRALAERAIGVILSDHHYWGGLRKVQELAAICDTFDLGLSMHSNSHLGISLAAMTHVAAAVPNLTYALDTHWPWKARTSLLTPSTFQEDRWRCRPVPASASNWIATPSPVSTTSTSTCGVVERSDTRYMQSLHPSYDATLPRW
jgi:glucarate dehydratase